MKKMKIFCMTSNILDAKIYIVIAETLKEANVMVSDAECFTGEYEVLWAYEVNAEKPGIVADYRPDSLTSSVIINEIGARKFSVRSPFFKGILPAKCKECGDMIGHFYNLIKGKEIKWHVCPKCADELVKSGWIVYGRGIH